MSMPESTDQVLCMCAVEAHVKLSALLVLKICQIRGIH